MDSSIQPIHCPIPQAEDFAPCDPTSLEPLKAALTAGTKPNGKSTFPCGILVDDGRLDLCKQRIGPLGTAALAGALS
jgi:hypothetical protein